VFNESRFTSAVLAIATYATKEYFYCWPQMVRRVAAAAGHHVEAHFIVSTDGSKESKAAIEAAKTELPEGWKVYAINKSFEPIERTKYKEESQMLIAALQGAAFSLARKLRASALWSVEADILVPPDALRICEWVAQMPQADGTPYYDIAAVTYPNGLFLGGFGTPHTHINEDFLPSERVLPPRLKRALEACKKRLETLTELKELDKEARRLQRLNEKVKHYPPEGTIWEIIAKHGWRRRGWMDFAYPGIGKGAIVPSDWCGLGCTLLSAKALALAQFEGYDGKGTQDLFLCWKKWHPAGLRIACIPHCPCDHVKLHEGKLVHYQSYHEIAPEQKDHLRVRSSDWIAC